MPLTATYEITAVDGSKLSVRYSCNGKDIDSIVDWNGEGDVHEFVKRFIPWQAFAAVAEHSTELVGTKGEASSEPTVDTASVSGAVEGVQPHMEIDPPLPGSG